MAKKSRRPRVAAPIDQDATVPVVGMREPCPCGSGKRYKLCHGKAVREREARVLPPVRPFEGLAGERDWVALRSFVPSATAPLRLLGEHAERQVLLCTVLPYASWAQVQPDNTIWLATQTQDPGSGDPSRDIAAALLAALKTEPGEAVSGRGASLDGPRLQDLIDDTAPLEVTVQPNVNYWIEDQTGDVPQDVVALVEQVNEAVDPTVRLTSVEAAYWVTAGGRTHLRWVMATDEDLLLDALARMHAAGKSSLVPGGRLIGSFRVHGLTTPVWELPNDLEATALEEPAKEFEAGLTEALAVSNPLTSAERGARAGLMSRQITIR